ncbi:MAG TPA: hypothetical protein VFI54_08030 [Solirubrobacteraceae bacterium]|nr:hypothetical protein [Solirubrobacteraceae bacterium]
MHLALLKGLVAVISASVIAVGVALTPAGNADHADGSPATSRASKLQTDGLQFLGQLVGGNVKPDPALKLSWTDDVIAVARSLGLSDRALEQQFGGGRSLAQIAASRGVPTSTPTTVLLRHIRDDLDRAERDRTVSPAAARALLSALGTAVVNP